MAVLAGDGLPLSLFTLTPLLPAGPRVALRSSAGRYYMAVAIASVLGAFVGEGCRALWGVGIGWHNLPSGVRGGLRGGDGGFCLCVCRMVGQVVFDVRLEGEFKGYLNGLVDGVVVFFWCHGMVVLGGCGGFL